MRLKFNISKYHFFCEVRRKKRQKTQPINFEEQQSLKLNFGPGPNWEKPDNSWLSVDIDPAWGDIIVDFQEFEGLPLEDNSVVCVYGSHVFEHISIFKTPTVFEEIYRVLKKEGVFRLILPDIAKSINEFVKKNDDFLLFKRRKEKAKKLYGMEYTLFECLKEDFLSRSGQIDLLGYEGLAHQNAWDYETIKRDLNRAGFHLNNITKMSFQESQSDYFSFEGNFPSEANEDYRSLYVEAKK